MTREYWIILVSITSMLAFSPGALAASQAHESAASLLPGQRHVKGTVEQIKGDQLEINTGEVQPRFIPLKQAREKGFPDIKVGDTIELTVNDQNLLVDYHLLDKSGRPVRQAKHHIVQGQIAQPLVVGHDKAVIRTEDGKELNLPIRSQARSKMASIPVGVDAVFMLDETKQIVDVNFASQEAAEQAGRLADQEGSLRGAYQPLKSAQQQVSGTVVKTLEENRITIRTRDGKEQPFEVRPLIREKMATLPKGKAVVLLIDGDNQVADVAVPPGP